MSEKNVAFCPKCKSRIEAKDFFSRGGTSDWRVEGPGVNITCPKCNHSGPPAEATPAEYKKPAGKGN